MPDQEHGRSNRHSSRGLKLISAIRHRLSRSNKESGSDVNLSENSPKEERLDNTESDDSQDSEISPSGSQSDKQNDINSNGSSVTGSDRRNNNDTLDILSAIFRGLKLDNPSPKQPKQPKQLKSILRRPPCYAHARGISGLPTKRIPVGRGYYRQPRKPIY